METSSMLAWFSLSVGALHMLAPDHWMPASLLSWQRRWRPMQVGAFVALMLTVHVLLGAAVYFAADDWLRSLPSTRALTLLFAFVFGTILLRSVRFSRIQRVQAEGPRSRKGLLGVLVLLGPCELMVPIFYKSFALGMGYAIPLVGFLVGTLLAGCALVLSARVVWNRPYWLNYAFTWVNRRLPVIPVACGLILGLRFLLRLT